MGRGPRPPSPPTSPPSPLWVLPAAPPPSLPSPRLLRCPPSEVLQAPVAPRRTKLLENHGDVREDAYYWLRDDDRADPDVIAHLEVRLGAAPAAGQARASVSCQG